MKRPGGAREAGRSSRSLRVSPGFEAFVLDQLEGLADVRARRMFGGVGLYCGELFFGIVARDVLYLKVDAASRRAYEKAGMKPFNPYPGRGATMQYYQVPLEVLEDPAALVSWAKRAVAAAEGRQRARSRE